MTGRVGESVCCGGRREPGWVPPPDWFDESLFAEPSAYECELAEEREALIEHVSRCADDGIRDYVADPEEEAAFARWVEGQVADWACEDGEPDISRQNAGHRYLSCAPPLAPG